jgi:hypothetical protein
MSLLPNFSTQVKSLKPYTCLPSHLGGWMYKCKGSQKGKEFKLMRVLLDSGCGGTLINISFVKKYKKKCKEIQKEDLVKVHQLDNQGRHFQDRLQGHMSIYLT